MKIGGTSFVEHKITPGNDDRSFNCLVLEELLPD